MWVFDPPKKKQQQKNNNNKSVTNSASSCETGKTDSQCLRLSQSVWKKKKATTVQICPSPTADNSHHKKDAFCAHKCPAVEATLSPWCLVLRLPVLANPSNPNSDPSVHSKQASASNQGHIHHCKKRFNSSTTESPFLVIWPA